MTTDDEHGRTPRRRALALGLGLAALGLVATAVVASVVTGLGLGGAVEEFVVTNSVMALAFPACGVLLAAERPRNPIGWLLIADGLGHGITAAAAPLIVVGGGAGWPEPVLRTLATGYAYAWPWSIALFLSLALLLFPDGRPVGPRWRWTVWFAIVTAPLFVVSVGAEPGATPGGTAPWFTIDGYAALAPLWTVSEILRPVVLVIALAALVVRYRRGDELRRRQLLWLALAVGLVAVVFVPWGVFAAGPVLILLAIPLVPVAMTVAILRHRLLDIRLVVSRAVLYALLTAAVVAVYLALVAASDVLLRRQVGLGASVLVTIVVAVGFNPVRVRLQRVVDRLLYGDRTDPVAVATRLGAQLATAGPGLEGVPAAVGGALRLPFTALRRGGVEIAAHGEAPADLHAVALEYEGERVGELVVGLRPGQRALDPADRRVLELVATPVAVALAATSLSEAVQRSREQIVAAREEERRRLRRDLHDGLGPTLTGVAFQADAARNLVRADPAEAAELLGRLRGAVTAAIDDVRRLVEGLRPPALDELGLVEALRREADRLAPVEVRIELDGPLPPLSAAVEVAAFRIATEALTNAVRHARARRVRLTLRCGSDLCLEVVDDGGPSGASGATGIGPERPWRAGVGLTSIAERAAELGGTAVAGPSEGGGLVRASLPLAAAGSGR